MKPDTLLQLLHPILLLVYAYLASLGGGEIPCFPSPTEVPSWHSESQRQWTEAGDWLLAASRAQLPNFSQNVVLQSWPRVGLGERRAGGRRGKIHVLTLVLAKAQDGTRVRSSMSEASSPWLQSQMPLWYQPQSPVSSRASVCSMKCKPKIWVGLASAFLPLWLPSTPCSSSADQCPRHLSRSRIAT